MGKIPFLRTDHGTLCESQAILDYIEAAYPNPALIPADPWQAAKVRELITFIDLHLELVAREIYGQAFFNAPADAGLTEKVRARLERSIGAFQRLGDAAIRVLDDFTPLVHDGRLRRFRELELGVVGDKNRLRHRFAQRRRHRHQGVHQTRWRASERAARVGRSQTGARALNCTKELNARVLGRQAASPRNRPGAP